jgi:ribosomal protein L11 methyltransferase
MAEKYHELGIKFNKKNYDSICGLLYLNGVKSILEENSSIKLCFNSCEINKLKSLKEKLLSLPFLNSKSIKIFINSSINWDNEWKKSIVPVIIKNKIIIYPSWKRKELKNTGGKILIEIDPKMSFGTGYSETTQLMLEIMCRYIDSNDHTMLDYGCGTGILAIAGIKLGLDSAIAIDIDTDSIANAKEYIAKNKVSKHIKIYNADINEIKEKDFDIIAANIDYRTIRQNLKSIHEKLVEKGKIFLSGILKKENTEMKAALKKNGFKKIAEVHKAEWTGIYAMKA